MRFWTVLILFLASACKCSDHDISWAGLSSIHFHILDGIIEVFGTDDEKKSLQVTSLERAQPVETSFSTGYLVINDDHYNSMAQHDLVCPSYILKYGVDKVDTLKVCFKIDRGECDGLFFAEVKVFWNQELMEYSDLIAMIK